MKKKSNTPPSWVTRGKTIRGLIQELQSFENQDLEVKISTDNGKTYKCISLVGKHNEDGIEGTFGVRFDFWIFVVNLLFVCAGGKLETLPLFLHVTAL